MLVVRLEVWPGGDGRMARVIDELRIGNVTELASVSDYVVFHGSMRAEVKGHVRDRGPWPLVAGAIKAMCLDDPKVDQ